MIKFALEKVKKLKIPTKLVWLKVKKNTQPKFLTL